MDYPLFLVPYIGGSWLIGGIAIFHVIIAHFAIGGGLLTVVTEQLAARHAVCRTAEGSFAGKDAPCAAL